MKRTLIGPPHAHLDAPCTDDCYMTEAFSDDVTTYDDKTLDKVRAGLREADPFLDERLLSDMISGMQNQGILFRERAPVAMTAPEVPRTVVTQIGDDPSRTRTDTWS